MAQTQIQAHVFGAITFKRSRLEVGQNLQQRTEGDQRAHIHWMSCLGPHAPAGMLHRSSLHHHSSSPVQASRLTDVQCPFCSLVVDRPVQATCGQLVRCRCIVEYMQHNDLESLSCCHGGHATLPIPAADMVIKVVGSPLIHCSTCQMAVELRQLRHHFDSGCQTTGNQQSHSKLWIRYCHDHWMLHLQQQERNWQHP